MPIQYLKTQIFDGGFIDPLNCECVKRVQVVSNPLGGTMLAWELSPRLPCDGEPHVYVDFSSSGTGDWQTVNKTPITDACIFSDLTRRSYDVLSVGFYRLRLVFPDHRDPQTGECCYCVSPPVQTTGLLSRNGYLLAREIIRKETLYNRKISPKLVWLLKRRRFGYRCLRCTDYDTNQVHAQTCTDCFGTGFLGGYFPGSDLSLRLEAPWDREFSQNQVLSTVMNPNLAVVRVGRCPASPYIDTRDIVAMRDTGLRYEVNKITTVAEVETVPIIVHLELKLVPSTDIVYQYPIGGVPVIVPIKRDTCGNEIAPSIPTEPEYCDWQTGLEAVNDYLNT